MAKPKKIRIQHAAIVRAFAARLRELRHATGMTQSELARRAELTETYISRLERGGAAPGIDLVDRLAKALGAATTDLIPLSAPTDRLAVLRQQAQTLFHNISQNGDHETLSLLNQFLAMLSEAMTKKR